MWVLLELSGTATRGDLEGDACAGTILLWIDGSPGDLHGSGRPTGTEGVRPPPTDSRGAGSDGRFGLWSKSSFDEEPGEERERVGV